MRAGRNIYQKLQRAVEEAEGRRLRHEADTLELRQRTAALVEDRGRALDELARHYLPELSEDAIRRAFTEIRDELRGVRDERERRIETLQADLDTLVEQRTGLEGELQTVTDELTALVAQRERLEAEVAARLVANSEFQTLSNEASQAEARLRQNEERAEELQQESAEKRPAYESSRLFMYLWERRYGTVDYDAGGLSRRLDRWVADLIGYSRAKAGYQFFCVTPELVGQEVARRRQEFDGLMERIEEIEDQAADAAGLTDVQRAGEKLGEERTRLEGEINTALQTHAQRRAELAPMLESRGRFYAEALARMRAYLQHAEMSALESEARQTESRRDDRLVAELGVVQRELREIERDIDDVQRALRQTQEHAAEMQGVLARFRRADYDSPQSFFDDLDDDVIEDAGEGEVSSRQLWSALERHQRFRRPKRVDFDFDFGDGLRSAGRVIGNVVRSPMSRVLVNAMGHVVGQALRGAANRSVARRGRPAARRRKRRGRPSFDGGFTTGDGF